MRQLPSGTLTLLFTDIEGSTRLLQELGKAYADVLAEHRRVLRAAFRRHGGVEVDTQGDAFFYAFARAPDAVAAATSAQEALKDGPVRVRIGVHTGEPIVTAEGYVGVDVHRAARIMGAGHGGQVLVSERTRNLLDGDAAVIDLGVHRLKDLADPEKLFQLGAGEFPPLKTLDATNLPVAASPLLGREKELTELVSLLHDGASLVTITGPGGTGKTRLALQVAAELVGSLPDGVFWVPLAGLTDPELVLPTIAQTIGARADLAEHLRGKQLLLLLDNAEHLTAAAPRLAELVATSPKLRLLVTSRAPLHLSAEREYPLEPLPTRDAVTLFLERARGAGRDLSADPTVEAICRRLDGLPLAIELAAARTKLLGPQALLERLERALPFLTGGPRDAPERQRTLRATIEWSYDLLDEDAKRLFAALSVFAGSFSLDAAEEICDADLDTLAALVDLSLLKPLGESRFLMLETIREYANERGDARGVGDTTRARHMSYFLHLAAQSAATLAAPTRPQLDVFTEDLANVRAALQRATVEQPERALRVAVDLALFWSMRNPSEGRHLIAAAYREDVDAGLRLEALGALSHLDWVVYETEDARAHAEAALRLAEEVGDTASVPRLLLQLSHIARLSGDDERGNQLSDEAIDIGRRLGDRALEGKLLWSRAAAEDDYGEPERALVLFEESLRCCEEADDERGIAHARSGIGVTRCRLGEWKDAREPLLVGLRYFDAVGDARSVAVSLDHLAGVAAATDEPARAARLIGAGDRAWRSIGADPEDAYRPPYLVETIDLARGTLGVEAFERAREAAPTPEESVRELLRDA